MANSVGGRGGSRKSGPSTTRGTKGTTGASRASKAGRAKKAAPTESDQASTAKSSASKRGARSAAKLPPVRLTTSSSVDDGGRRPPRDGAAALHVERVQPSYVQVAGQLRALILGRQLLPGERLPAEAELSAKFGVSRSTTREALRLLAAEKLIETRRGVTGGTFVTHPDPHDIEIALSTAVNMAANVGLLTQDDVFEVWQFTQPVAARLAARRRTAEQIEMLRRLAASASPAEDEASLTLRAIDFHRAVLEAANNELLQILTRPLSGLGAATIEGRKGARQFLADVHKRHQAIAEAIADGDEERASAAMTADMEAPGDFHSGRSRGSSTR